MRRTLRSCILIWLLHCLASPAQATSARRANLLDLCDDARTIVAGTVLRVETGSDAGSHLPVKEVTLRLRAVLKSKDPRGHTRGPGNTYSFKQYYPGAKRSHVPLPDYQVGEEVVLFLAGRSDLGLTAPIGLTQGKFTVTPVDEGSSGEALIANAYDNANLSVTDPESEKNGRAARARGRIGALKAAREESDILTRRVSGPVDYRSFISLVRKLVQGSGSEKGGR
jgi:hypothetical protein